MSIQKFVFFEDSGDGLYLAVFDKTGKVVYFHSGFEYHLPTLLDTYDRLLDGEDPLVDSWDGNSEYPQAEYDSFVGEMTVIADNERIYTEQMGNYAREAFQVEDAAAFSYRVAAINESVTYSSLIGYLQCGFVVRRNETGACVVHASECSEAVSVFAGVEVSPKIIERFYADAVNMDVAIFADANDYANSFINDSDIEISGYDVDDLISLAQRIIAMCGQSEWEISYDDFIRFALLAKVVTWRRYGGGEY